MRKLRMHPIQAKKKNWDQFIEEKEFNKCFELTPESLQLFTDASGDESPIHVSDSAAKLRGFLGRVVHGSYLASLATSLVGMEFPGESAVIHSFSFQFHNPAYLNKTIQICLRIEHFSPAVQTAVLKVKITSEEQKKLVSGKIQVGFTQVSTR